MRRALFRYRKDVPHRAPELLHLRYEAVLKAERCARVSAYVRRTHARCGGDSGDRRNASGAHRLHLLVLAVLQVLDDRRRGRRGCWSVLWQLGEPCLRVPSPKLRKVGLLSKGQDVSGGSLQRISVPFLSLEEFSITLSGKSITANCTAHRQGLFAVLYNLYYSKERGRSWWGLS